jgi:hypothetical protein
VRLCFVGSALGTSAWDSRRKRTGRSQRLPAVAGSLRALQSGRTKAARPRAEPERGAQKVEQRRVALVVLGMHRSGTSALAGVLGLLGAQLPKTQIPANARNPRGFFESELLYRLHDELLQEVGAEWGDLRPLPAGWLESVHAEAWIDRLAAAAGDEYGDAQLWVLKDPRLCRLVPLWRRVLAALDVEPRFLLPVRNPLECSASLFASSGTPESVGLLLWLDYFLQAERDTRDLPRAFLTYDALLAEAASVTDRLERELDVLLPRSASAAAADVGEFLSRDLRKQAAAPEEVFERADVSVWVKDAYAWALQAAEGESPAASRIDPIREQLEVAEAAFGPALATSEDARRTTVRALESQLTAQTETYRRATRMLMRWIVDGVRDGERPVPEFLRATVTAIDDADPAAIPGLSFAGLLLSELQRERALHADQLAAIAKRLDWVEAELASSGEDLSTNARELEARQELVDQLRQVVADQQKALRVLGANPSRVSEPDPEA